MDDSKTFAEVAEITATVEAIPEPEQLLKFQQEMWVDFNALGGLLLEADGSFKMSDTRVKSDGTRKKYGIEDFAEEMGVTTRTLYNWRNSIPDFWGRVAARRKILGSQQRVAKVWNGVFLKAAAGHATQANMFLLNFDPAYISPAQKQAENDANTLIELMNQARNTRKVIDGEVVDKDKADA